MMQKVEVKGDNTHCVYEAMQKATNEVPQWNFAKYLVDASGNATKFYAHGVAPNDLIPDVEAMLN